MRLTKVEILRETIKIVAAALAEKSIPITQRGGMAYVEWDKRTGKPKRINIPFIPDNASERLIKAVQGFVDHECAHVLFTDFNAVKDAAKAGVGTMHNILEDTYIERNMKELYRGSRHNLNEVWGFIAEEMLKPKLDTAIAMGDRKMKVAAGLPIAIHAWAGSERAVDFMKDRIAHFDDVRRIFGDDLIDKIPELEDSRDCFRLAVSMQNRFNEWKEELERERMKSVPDPDGDMEAPGEGDGSDEDDDEFDEPVSDAGDVDFEDDDDEDFDESDDEPGKSSGESSDDDEDEEGDEVDGSAAVDGDEEDPDETEETDRRDGLTDGDDDEEDSDEPDHSEEEEDSEGTEDGEDESSGDEEEDDDEGFTEEEIAEFEEALKEMEDLDAMAEKVIADEMEEALSDADYWPLTKDFDVIERYTPEHVDETYVRRAQEDVKRHVGILQKQLERSVAARSHSRHIPGYRSGRLHGAALYRVATGDDRVFRRKHEFKTKDVDVQLVVDLSGSMSGSKVALACECAYALAEALDRLNINNQVVGFTTKNSFAVSRAEDEVERTTSRYPSRTEALYMPILKDWSQRFTADRKVATLMAGRDVALANNIDGESLEYAARMLTAQGGSRKVMIVLSDGAPCAAGSLPEQSVHLKRVIKRLEQSGMELFGIGIMTESVKRYYTHYEVVRELEELPTKVMTTMQNLLLRNAA